VNSTITTISRATSGGGLGMRWRDADDHRNHHLWHQSNGVQRRWRLSIAGSGLTNPASRSSNTDFRSNTAKFGRWRPGSGPRPEIINRDCTNSIGLFARCSQRGRAACDRGSLPSQSTTSLHRSPISAHVRNQLCPAGWWPCSGHPNLDGLGTVEITDHQSWSAFRHDQLRRRYRSDQ